MTAPAAASESDAELWCADWICEDEQNLKEFCKALGAPSAVASIPAKLLANPRFKIEVNADKTRWIHSPIVKGAAEDIVNVYILGQETKGKSQREEDSILSIEKISDKVYKQRMDSKTFIGTRVVTYIERTLLPNGKLQSRFWVEGKEDAVRTTIHHQGTALPVLAD